MTTTKPATGSCLCGSVDMQVKAMDTRVSACHCTMCRNWGGGPLLAVDCGSDVQLSNHDLVGVYRSSQWAERGFCTRCGTHLFYRLRESGKYIVPVGLFGDDPALTFAHQIFIDEKPEYYRFADNTLNMTGAEVFAKSRIS